MLSAVSIHSVTNARRGGSKRHIRFRIVAIQLLHKTRFWKLDRPTPRNDNNIGPFYADPYTSTPIELCNTSMAPHLFKFNPFTHKVICPITLQSSTLVNSKEAASY